MLRRDSLVNNLSFDFLLNGEFWRRLSESRGFDERSSLKNERTKVELSPSDWWIKSNTGLGDIEARGPLWTPGYFYG